MWGTVLFAFLFVSVLPITISAGAFPSVIVCENRGAYLTCPGGSLIRVHSAVYGRTYDGSICPSRHIRTTHCKSSISDGKVKGMCNNKTRCYIRADNKWYGDPCRGTYKYLEVNYKCVY